MKHWQAAITITWAITLLMLVSIVFYVVPERWILDYRSIHVTTECVNGFQVLHAESERYPKITLQGRGEDNIYLYPKDASKPVRRLEFDNATYRRGTTGDGWDIKLDLPLPSGNYILVGEPQVSIFIYTRSLDPILSNVFTIDICDQKT